MTQNSFYFNNKPIYKSLNMSLFYLMTFSRIIKSINLSKLIIPDPL